MPELVLNGKVTKNGRTWHSWIREPVLSPDGKTLAMVSDRPEPVEQRRRAPVLRPRTRRSRRSRRSTETPPLGHQDPAWRPDGKYLLYVRNGRDGRRGAPDHLSLGRGQDEARRALTGPGYLEPPSRPTAGTSPRPRPSSFGNDLVILDASNGRELLRADQRRRRRGRRSGRRPATRSRSSTSTARSSTSGWSGSTAPAPNWTVKDVDRPDRGVRASTARRGRTGSSRADQLPDADADAVPSAAPSRLRRRRASVTADLPRAAGGPDRGGRAASCASGSTRTRPRCRAASRRDLAGRRAVRPTSSSRRPRRTPRRSSRTSRSTRRSASAGLAALERIRARIPPDVPVVVDAKRGDIGIDGGPPGGRAVRSARGRCGHGQPVPGRRGDRAAARARSTASPTSCAGRRTRAPASSRTSSSPPTRRPAPRPSRSTCASPGASSTWGPGGTVGLVVGATAPAELARDPGRRARAGVPRPGRRGPGRRDRAGPCATARRPRHRPVAGRRAADCSSTSRAGSARRPSARPGDGGPGDPGERLAAGRRDWASRLPVLP